MAEESKGTKMTARRNTGVLIREWLWKVDLADLGAGYPKDEYDSIAVLVSEALDSRNSVHSVFEQVRRHFLTEWGVSLSEPKAEMLRRELLSLQETGHEP